MILGCQAMVTELKSQPAELLVRASVQAMLRGTRYTAHTSHVDILVDEPELVLVLQDLAYVALRAMLLELSM